jgi:AbiV family abortive infection protein
MPRYSIEQIQLARTFVLENAAELIDEAELLLRHDRAARSYALAHLACEELAKLPMLLRIALDLTRGKSVDWSKFARRFRSHTEKIDNLHAMDYYRSDVRPGNQDYADFEAALRTTTTLAQRKNGALYVDFQSGKAQKPALAIDRATAEVMLLESRKRFRLFVSFENRTHQRLQEMAAGFDMYALAESFLTKARSDPSKSDA